MTPPSKICNAKPLRIGGTPKDRKQAKGVTKAVTPFAVGEQLQSSARDEVLMERGNVQYAGHSCVRGVWVRRAHIRECPDYTILKFNWHIYSRLFHSGVRSFHGA